MGHNEGKWSGSIPKGLAKFGPCNTANRPQTLGSEKIAAPGEKSDGIEDVSTNPIKQSKSQKNSSIEETPSLVEKAGEKTNSGWSGGISMRAFNKIVRHKVLGSQFGFEWAKETPSAARHDGYDGGL